MYGKQAIQKDLEEVINYGYNFFPYDNFLKNYSFPVSPISVENMKLVLEKATEDDLRDFKLVVDTKITIWDKQEEVSISIDGDKILHIPSRTITCLRPTREGSFSVDRYLNLVRTTNLVNKLLNDILN